MEDREPASSPASSAVEARRRRHSVSFPFTSLPRTSESLSLPGLEFKQQEACFVQGSARVPVLAAEEVVSQAADLHIPAVAAEGVVSLETFSEIPVLAAEGVVSTEAFSDVPVLAAEGVVSSETFSDIPVLAADDQTIPFMAGISPLPSEDRNEVFHPEEGVDDTGSHVPTSSINNNTVVVTRTQNGDEQQKPYGSRSRSYLRGKRMAVGVDGTRHPTRRWQISGPVPAKVSISNARYFQGTFSGLSEDKPPVGDVLTDAKCTDDAVIGGHNSGADYCETGEQDDIESKVPGYETLPTEAFMCLYSVEFSTSVSTTESRRQTPEDERLLGLRSSGHNTADRVKSRQRRKPKENKPREGSYESSTKGSPFGSTKGLEGVTASTQPPTRALSQIPENGYLWKALSLEKASVKSQDGLDRDLKVQRGKSATTRGSPSSGRVNPPNSDFSGGSSLWNPSSELGTSCLSDSLSVSERKRSKRDKYREKAKQRRRSVHTGRINFKCPEPTTYDGKANLEVFESFVFELKNWLNLSGMPRKYRMFSIKKFLAGKAGSHYMTFVAPNPKRYTVDTYLKELFDHCFPPHFRSQMRKRFNNCMQGSRTVREFSRELQTLGNRLPDVKDVHLCLQFWKGALPYLRSEWARAGLDPECSTLEELELAAERFENAETLRRKEASESESESEESSDSSHSANEKRSNQGTSSRSDRSETKEEFSCSESEDLTSGDQSNDGSSEDDEGLRQDAPKSSNWNNENRMLSKSEINELRAANKCFTCKKVGHISRNCRARKKAMDFHVGTMSFSETMDSVTDLHLGMMHVEFGPSRTLDEVESDRALNHLDAAESMSEERRVREAYENGSMFTSVLYGRERWHTPSIQAIIMGGDLLVREGGPEGAITCELRDLPFGLVVPASSSNGAERQGRSEGVNYAMDQFERNYKFEVGLHNKTFSLSNAPPSATERCRDEAEISSELDWSEAKSYCEHTGTNKDMYLDDDTVYSDKDANVFPKSTRFVNGALKAHQEGVCKVPS